MSFSTVDQARYNLGQVLEDLTRDSMMDPTVKIQQIIENRIGEADKEVKALLSPYIPPEILITWVDILDVNAYSRDTVNLLSQYKTCELSLVHLYPNKQGGEDRKVDILYWQRLFNTLLEMIKTGSIIMYYPEDAVNVVTPSISTKEQTTFGEADYGGV
jgi:hypothetical protein